MHVFKCSTSNFNLHYYPQVECDAAMKQLLLHLDETHALGNKFIVQDLDETHVFIVKKNLNYFYSLVG
jgi:TFIIH basal transcription factor complex TTD-A subunit